MITRQRFRLSTSGGVTVSDSGNLAGSLEQIRWSPDTNDTGQVAALEIALLPDTDDTGLGWNVHRQAAINLGVGFTEGILSSDTGSLSVVAIVGANDRLRVRAVPADTGVVLAGTLYAWSDPR